MNPTTLHSLTTGASRGPGTSTVYELAQQHWNLVIKGREKETKNQPESSYLGKQKEALSVERFWQFAFDSTMN